MSGWKHPPRMAAACLCVATIAIGCGRLGFGAREEDAAIDQAAADSSEMEAASADGSPRDAGDAADGQVRDAVAGDGTTDGSASDGDGSVATGLDNTGLLVRYWLDEAGSGQGVVALADSASDPLDVPLVYLGSSPTWAGAAGNRHLVFSGVPGVDTGGGRMPIVGTKVEALHGSQTVTLELKYALDSCVAGQENEGRIVQIAVSDEGENSFMLASRVIEGRDGLYGTFVETTFSFTVHHFLETPCPVTVPSVVHWVIDTTESLSANRVRSFINGVEVTAEERFPAGIGLGTTIDLGTGPRGISIGRTHSDIRTLNGRIFYVAIYARALPPTVIATHASRLMARDDP